MSTSSATPARPLTRGRALAPDLARGSMLLMIALAHAHLYLSGGPTGFRGYATDGGTLDDLVAGLQVALVDGRAMPMFAALFGYGFTRIAARHDDPADARRTLRRRSTWLLVFGFAHALLLFFGDVLAAYGLVGLLLVGVLRLRDRTLLAVAAAWLVVHGTVIAVNGAHIAAHGGPADAMATADPLAAVGARLLLWSALTVLLLLELLVPFLLGVWAGRRRVLEEPHRHLPLLRVTAGAGITTAVLGGLPLALVDAGVWTGAPAALTVPAYVAHGLTGVAGGLGCAALVSVLAHRLGGRRGALVTALAACGQRSMTSYLLQSVVFVAVFVPCAGGLGDDLGTAAASGIAVLTWAATVLLADALRRHDLPGPAEHLLRRLTRGTRHGG